MEQFLQTLASALRGAGFQAEARRGGIVVAECWFDCRQRWRHSSLYFSGISLRRRKDGSYNTRRAAEIVLAQLSYKLKQKEARTERDKHLAVVEWLRSCIADDRVTVEPGHNLDFRVVFTTPDSTLAGIVMDRLAEFQQMADPVQHGEPKPEPVDEDEE